MALASVGVSYYRAAVTGDGTADAAFHVDRLGESDAAVTAQTFLRRYQQHLVSLNKRYDRERERDAHALVDSGLVHKRIAAIAAAAAVAGRSAHRQAHHKTRAAETASRVTPPAPPPPRRRVRFSVLVSARVFARCQGGSGGVPRGGAFSLGLDWRVARETVERIVDGADTADTEDGVHNRRYPIQSTNALDDELPRINERERLRLIQAHPTVIDAGESAELEDLRKSRQMNFCQCRPSDGESCCSDTARCACARDGVGCHIEGTHYCGCNAATCSNGRGKYVFDENKVRQHSVQILNKQAIEQDDAPLEPQPMPLPLAATVTAIGAATAANSALARATANRHATAFLHCRYEFVSSAKFLWQARHVAAAAAGSATYKHTATDARVLTDGTTRRHRGRAGHCRLQSQQSQQWTVEALSGDYDDDDTTVSTSDVPRHVRRYRQSH